MGKLTETHVGIADVRFGENVKLTHPVNLTGRSIGNNYFVGPFTEIQNTATIGDGCRMQSHTSKCEFVEIGNHRFISHSVKFVNDLFSIGRPAGGNTSLWKKTNIGNQVSIGTNATILPLNIVDNVVIGAGSVVIKNITKPGIYAGNPSRFLRKTDPE